MRKDEIKQIVDELRQRKSYWNPENGVDSLFKMLEPLDGVGLPDFPKGKMIPKEVIVQFLRYQCLMMNGSIDYEELEKCIEIFRLKRIIMI